jgi:hypothetical protein
VKSKAPFGAAVIALAPFLSLLVVSSLTVASVGESEENVHLVPATEPPGAWTLQWTGRTGRTYFVQHSHDLHSWTYINTIKHGEGAQMLGTSSTGSKYFLRLRHTDIPCVDPATADFDGDGLNNADELIWLCDPFLADSDGDGFSDGWEVMVGWEPKQNNADQAHLDPDGDGWDNATEHIYSTNPNLADSDEDGLDDPDDADPNDLTIDWPRTPEATRVWLPLTGYDPSTHGAPVALSNTGIALFEKAIWKGGVWKTLEWQKDGPAFTHPDEPEPLHTKLRAIRALDIADNGRVLGSAELLFVNAQGTQIPDPRGGDLGQPGASIFAVQWTEQAGIMIMEITGEHVSGGLDIESFELLPKAAGVSPEGVLFTLRETGAGAWQWGRHGPENWKDAPVPTFIRQAGEFVPDLYHGGVSAVARHTLRGGNMGVSNSGSGNRLLAADGTPDLPDGPGYVCGSLADNRAAFVSTASGTSGLQLRPHGNTLDFRPVPKLSGTAAFNARGEAISHDGRFWQNGKWLAPVSEGNTPPTGTMHLHDLNDHGVMFASAGEDAGNGQTEMPHGAEPGLVVPMGILADTNRDAKINFLDHDGKDQFTNQRGAVYVVNYDHDEGLANAMEDCLRWKSSDDGLDEFGAKKTRIRPQGENWAIDVAKEEPADLTPIEIRLPTLPANVRVFLKVEEEKPEDAKAFHLYIAKHDTTGAIAQYVPLWGGINFENAAPESVVIGPEVEITKWVNPDADGYEETRGPIAGGPYKLYLEGTIFKGMPIPGNDGFGRYDGTSPYFDGDIKIGIEIRESTAAMAGNSWIKLSHCAVEPEEPGKVLAFGGEDPHMRAQGFGKYAKGGRYGHVYTVTSIADSDADPATLRYAVESAVPRTVVFALQGNDGNITLTEPLKSTTPRLTIAGQTAFQNGASGVCLKNYGLRIQSDDAVVRYLRSRPGAGNDGHEDAINIVEATRVMVDHCSTSFSTDTLIDVSHKSKTPGRLGTVQNCILAWPLDRNNHVEDGNLQDHGYGSLVSAGYGARITYWRNLYAHCRGRCPRPAVPERAQDDPNGLQFDFASNVIFSWWEMDAGYDDKEFGKGRYNFVGNYYRGGGVENMGWGDRKFFRIKNSEAQGWFTGNRIKLPPANGPITPGLDDGRSQYHEDFITYGGLATEQTFRVADHFPSGEFAVPILPQPQGEQSVKAKVGASLKRDALDIRLLGVDGMGGEYETRQGGLINTPEAAGGWPVLPTAAPPLDSDKDGIPDDKEPDLPPNRVPHWKHDPRNAHLDDDGDGHTNLEEYLTEITNP